MTFETKEAVEWKDNLGHEIREGDFVFALNGKYSFERVIKLSIKTNPV